MTSEEKRDAELKYMYKEGKRFCKNALQASMFISPLICMAIVFVLSIFTKTEITIYWGIAVIILQDAAMYIVYRIIDYNDDYKRDQENETP